MTCIFRWNAQSSVGGSGGAQSLYNQFIALVESRDRLARTACLLASVNKEPGTRVADEEAVAAEVTILKEKMRKKKIGENGEAEDLKPPIREEMPGEHFSLE